jgi:parvulin-like peptidyl-prolyl isomerase
MTIHRTRRFGAAGAAIALIAGLWFAGNVRAADTTVVAQAGTVSITADDVRTYLGTLDPRTRAAIDANPQLLSQAVRVMLAQQLAVKQALDQKWDQQPAVAAQLDRIRQGAIGELYVQTMSKPAEDFPSDADVQSAYDANRTAFLVPRQFHLAQIFVAVPKDADKAADAKARAKLDEVEKKLKQKGADFAAIAQSFSDEPASGAHGGELGWMLETQIRPEISRVAVGLADGGVSDPVKLDDGWHILKLLGTKAAYTRPLSEVHDQIVQQLRANRATENRRLYLTKLLEQNQSTVNEIALEQIVGHGQTATAATH